MAYYCHNISNNFIDKKRERKGDSTINHTCFTLQKIENVSYLKHQYKEYQHGFELETLFSVDTEYFVASPI